MDDHWDYSVYLAALRTPDPSVYDQQIPMPAPVVPPLILDGSHVLSPLDPAPGPTFDQRYPLEGVFPPMNYPFADRFPMEWFTHGSDFKADGGRQRF